MWFGRYTVFGQFSKILSCSLLGFAFIFKKYSVVAYSVLALFSKNTRLIMLGYEIFSKNTRFEMVGYTIILKKWSVTRWSVRPCFWKNTRLWILGYQPTIFKNGRLFANRVKIRQPSKKKPMNWTVFRANRVTLEKWKLIFFPSWGS